MTPAVSSFPNVTRQELKVRGRLISFPTLHVRKTGKCHREAWVAGWQFPNVTRQEQNLRERPIFILTLHVRKTPETETENMKLVPVAGIQLSQDEKNVTDMSPSCVIAL